MIPVMEDLRHLSADLFALNMNYAMTNTMLMVLFINALQLETVVDTLLKQQFAIEIAHFKSHTKNKVLQVSDTTTVSPHSTHVSQIAIISRLIAAKNATINHQQP